MVRKIRAFHDFPEAVQVGDVIQLTDAEGFHLSKVLRTQNNDSIEILNGKGIMLAGKCFEVVRNNLKVMVKEKKIISASSPQFHIGVALTKGKQWEDLIRPLTELGAFRISPLLTERTEVRQRKEKLIIKHEKWRKFSSEACKQSGNPWLPVIDQPSSLSDFLKGYTDSDDLWIGSLNAGSQKIVASGGTDRVFILIGPEGGWSSQEEKTFLEKDGKLFSLGPYTLRVENAAVGALTVARTAYLP